MIHLRHRYYQQFDADFSRDVPAEGYAGWKEGSIAVDPVRTALVVMHAWDCGSLERYPGWFRACDEIPRTYEVCRKVLPPILAAARASGLSVYHVVADGASYFRDLPGYRRAVALAEAAGGEASLPRSLRARRDDVTSAISRFRSEHVFPGAHNAADISAGWKQVDFPIEARPSGEEGIAEDARQLAALASDEGVNHLIYVGFNIDWCLLMSPAGMIDMNRLGYVCSTIGQAVTAVENAQTARSELAKEIGLWRVSVNFGCVFDATDFASSLVGVRVERPAKSVVSDARATSARAVPVAPKDFILTPSPTWMEFNGQIYGAKPDTQGPLGGGAGYTRVARGGDRIVTTEAELIEALAGAKAGQTIFIPGDVELDFTDWVFTNAPFSLGLPAGVTLAGDRGLSGSRGALLKSDAFQTSPLIEVLGPDARITGLRLRGPDPDRRLAFHHRVFYEIKGDDDGSKAYYSFPNSDAIRSKFGRLEVDNCEISAWSHAGVFACGGPGYHVHHCHIHHTQRMGLGYGVCVHMDSQCLVEFCVFQDNKHHIASSGMPGVGYEARHNLVLPLTRTHLGRTGKHYGQDHLFDMHGGRDRLDGTDIAGSFLRVHHNTFVHTPEIVPVCIRGVPQEAAHVYRNWFYAAAPGPRVVDTGGCTEVVDNAYGPPKQTRFGLDPGALPADA